MHPPHATSRVFETLNFALTNRFPRLLVSRLMGVISRWQHPFFVQPALWLWQNLADLNLHEAEKSSFDSLGDCFTRALKQGARPIDPDADFVSPCDGILGASGLIEQGTLLQIKGMPYHLSELLLDAQEAAVLEGFRYLTVRITASMYHRLHSPCDLQVSSIQWITGDCWNVNPIALKRVQKLFCRNHRAILRTQNQQGETCVIVPVAAVLVGALRLHALGQVVNQNTAPFKRLAKDIPGPIAPHQGQELGWFEHGSTVVMLVPAHYRLAEGLAEGSALKAGQKLLMG